MTASRRGWSARAIALHQVIWGFRSGPSLPSPGGEPLSRCDGVPLGCDCVQLAQILGLHMKAIRAEHRAGRRPKGKSK